MTTVRTFCLYDGIDGVDNSVAGDYVEGGDVGTSGGAFNLDELGTVGRDGLTTSSLEGSGAGGNILALEGGARHNVTQQDGGQSLLVGEQTVQVSGRNLVKSRVGGSEHGERSFASQSVDKFGGLNSGKQGGELRGGDHKFSNVLGGGRCLLYNDSRGMVNHGGVVDSRGVVDNRSMMNSRGMVDDGGMMDGRGVVGSSMEAML
jgi:hypothetical protein